MLSPQAARLAAQMGYKNIKVFHAGAPAWRKDGQPLLVTGKFVESRLENVVLIDVRGAEAAKKGHIQGAFSVPLDKVVAARDQFPLDTKVPIILYGEGTDLNRIAPVIEELAAWTDNAVFVLDGGYKGWIKAKGKTSTAKLRTDIVYLPRPVPGEVVGDEFMNIVKSQPENKILLDVRTPEETAEGKISWATLIPLDDLSSRLAELPKDKEIIIHCGTGMRASMAYTVLKQSGFITRYLNDKVAFLEKRPICCFKD